MTSMKAIQAYLNKVGIQFEKNGKAGFKFTKDDKEYFYHGKYTIAQMGKLISLIDDFDKWLFQNCSSSVAEMTTKLEKATKKTPTKVKLEKAIPSEYDGYYFPSFINNIARRVENGSNVFLTGESGAGKTECVEKLAKYLGKQLLSVDFSVGTNSQELIGKFIVKNGATEFVYGIVPLAMKNGWWLNFNELDYASPEHLSILQGVLTGKPLLIAQNEIEVIEAHKDFRIFATANTKGRGTDSGYTGTNFLNLAFLDRWSIFEINYTDKEPDIINSITENKDTKFTEMLVSLFDLLRKSAKEGKILNAVFTTRRMKEIAASMNAGESFADAIQYDLIGRFEESEQNLIKEFAQDIFENSTYFRKKWYLSDTHFDKSTINQVNNDVH